MPESPQSPKSSRNAELSSFFTLRITKVSTVKGIRGGRGRQTQNCRHFWTRLGSSRLKSVNFRDRGGVVVAKPKTVVTFGLVSGLRVSKASISGIGGSWLRNAELSSLLDSPRVFASQKCQQSQGSGGRGCETQNCRHFWTCLGSSRLKSVNFRDRGGRGCETQNCRTFGLASGLRVSKVSISGIGGVVVAKPKTVVTFGLVSGLRVSKASISGIGGSWLRNAELSSLLDSSRVFASQKCQFQGWGGRCRETQNCRHCWTRLGSSRLKSVNSHRDPGGVVAKRRTVVTFGLVSGLRVSKASISGIGGSWLRNAELVASQKCQQSQGSGHLIWQSLFALLRHWENHWSMNASFRFLRFLAKGPAKIWDNWPTGAYSF